MTFSRLSLFLIAVVFNSLASAEERLLVSDYRLTERCEAQVKKYGHDTFEIQNDAYSTPTISVRHPEADVRIEGVRFEAFFYGLLIERGSQAFLYCYQKHAPNFIVVERSERYMFFENGARQATEVHIHGYISCGVNCGFARSETITFFDYPEVPADEQGMLHSVPIGAIHTQNGDTYPNEYPSRWFRSYLTDEERVIFDRIIDEG